MATIRRSGLACFSKSDISFEYVENAVKELQNAGYIELLAMRSVSNDRVCSNNADGVDTQFGSYEYDFAQILGATLRHFMLEATGLRNYFDPLYGVRAKPRNTSKKVNFTVDYSPPGMPESKTFSIGQNKIIAQLVSGEYDRMYTSYNIRQRVLEDHYAAKIFITSMSSLMYVVDIENKLLYEISTICKVDHSKKENNIYYCPKPHVSCVKAKITATEEQLEALPKYIYLRTLIRNQKAKDSEETVDATLLGSFKKLMLKD